MMELAAIPYPDIPPLQLGPLTLYPFGFLVGLAIILGTVVADRRARTLGLNRKVIADVSLWAVVGGFIGAHLYSAIFYFPERILEDPLYLLMFWDGISSFGGFLGGAGAVVYYFHRKKLPFFPYADCIVYGFAFAWVFGRLGCTVAYDHPGLVTDFAMGMMYPEGRELESAVRHNLGFYEAIWAVVMSVVFFATRKRTMFSGWYLAVFVIAYMPIRFGFDFLRVVDKTYLGMTAGQYAAIVLMGVGIWLYTKRKAVGEQMIPDGEIHIFQDGTPAIGSKESVEAQRKQREAKTKKRATGKKAKKAR